VLANDTAGPGQSINPSSVTIMTAPQQGTATVDSTTGSVTYQPTTSYSGSDSFQYTVRDGLGAKSNVATVSVRVQPAPVATNDTTTLQSNQSVTINVLSNATSNGGTLNTASITVVVPPTHGTAAVMNGEVVYTPTSGYSGLDTFQYSVQDNLGTTSNVATVSIDVTAPPHSGGGSLDGLALAGLAAMLAASRFGDRTGRSQIHKDRVPRFP
jgi:large repetitive protein